MNNVKFLSLFFPLLISLFLIDYGISSYIAAWLGSFYLFYLSLAGFISPLPDDLPFAQQLMRPVFIIQIVFCGFNFCTSIFFFLDTLGMEDFVWRKNYFVDTDKILKIANAQRYYLLGHVFLLLGMYSRRVEFKKKLYVIKKDLDWSLFLLAFTGFTLAFTFAARFIPGLSQISEQFRNLSFMSGTYAFCYAIIKKERNLIFAAGTFYGFNFVNILLSGFKEPIIISLLLVGIFMYPYYKKVVLFLGLPFIYVAFVIIPAYVSVFRTYSNLENNSLSSEEIRDRAFKAALGEKSDESSVEATSNWEFLTGRLSEISMFTRYIESTPKYIPFYETNLLEQAIIVLVPRAFWPEKPITEELVMKRVIDAKIVESASKVSAKPMYIVDGYLSGGALGVMISLFLYGFALQWLSGLSEKWFGGYFLGTAIMFNGLFPILWRGLSFEFILNSVLYSLLTMYLVQRVLYSYGFLERNYEDSTHSPVL